MDLTVFDDYAGEHRITAEGGDKLAETYFSIYAYVSEFSEKVRVGEPIKVRLYPAIYEGEDAAPNIYSSPNLTYLTDHPGGVLSAFRLTLTVTE